MNERIFDIFHYQYNYCPVYKQYVDLLGVSPFDVKKIEEIPFLPIKFFKTHTIISSADSAVEAEKIFYSSATTSIVPSKHYVTDLSLYIKSFTEGFEYFYGNPNQYAILALLPSYLEREGSSLVFMANHLIFSSHNPDSGFYLYNHSDLYQKLNELRRSKQKTILIGVTFALLDFASQYSIERDDEWQLSIIETGGMKGRGEELSRKEIHRRLSESFSVNEVGSEYGMCEMLSQAYSKRDGIFYCSPSMKVMIRDINDPFKTVDTGKTGGINIIDMANVNSCSFIETQDRGYKLDDGGFCVLGRISGAENRGCNMLIE